MSAADILVIVAAVAALAGLGWFFFGPRRAKPRCWRAGCSGWKSRSRADTALR